MAVKRKGEENAEAELDPGLQLLYDHIREQFVANARPIAHHEKPERLLKMLQSCPELKSVSPQNKDLWKIVQKVRREVLKETRRNGNNKSNKSGDKK